MAKGFRPFFLCAAAYGALVVPLFLLSLAGRANTGPYLVPMYWHAHEMIFGFSTAVLAGFLLTAIANWTERPTAHGRALGALVALWLAGRAGMLFSGQLPRFAPAILDLAFAPGLVAACAQPLLTAKNRRNYGFIGMLAALWLANAMTHAAALGVLSPVYAQRGNLVGVDVLVIALVVMTGRVVPMFTRNALRANDVRARPTLERVTLAAVVSIAGLEAAGAPTVLTGSISFLGGIFAAVRMMSWGTRRTVRDPLLWVLHAGSAWISVGLLLRGVASFAPVPMGAGLHALTAGAIGSLTLGMMARVALGHTGRMLSVSPRIAVAFASIIGAGVTRVLAPLVMPGALAPLVVSGTLWSLAFSIYFVTYAPILVAPRVDGRPG